MREPFASMERWYRKGRRFAFATLERTGPGGPRDPGSCMAVNEFGDIAGSVSGGCIEGAVAAAALEVIETGVPQTLVFGEGFTEGGRTLEADNADGPAALADAQDRWDVDALCSGAVEVLVSPFDDGVLALMQEERDGECPRIVCVGAVHIAASLCRLACEVGYRTVVVDPRRAFAGSSRFGAADEVVVGWPQEVLPRLELGPDDAVAALSHDAKIDVPALAAALGTRAFYIGCLGHAETLQDRREALLGLGVEPGALRRVFGPVGLFLGGREPEEIALSALAQIQAVRYGRIGNAAALPGCTLDLFTPEHVARIAAERDRVRAQCGRLASYLVDGVGGGTAAGTAAPVEAAAAGMPGVREGAAVCA